MIVSGGEPRNFFGRVPHVGATRRVRKVVDNFPASRIEWAA
jgi:hypothetical protein